VKIAYNAHLFDQDTGWFILVAKMSSETGTSGFIFVAKNVK
jgi:hypothetical protein